jgi:hypothetical protein
MNTSQFAYQEDGMMKTEEFDNDRKHILPKGKYQPPLKLGILITTNRTKHHHLITRSLSTLSISCDK